MISRDRIPSVIEALSCIRCGADYAPHIAIDSRGCPACFEMAPSNFAVKYTAASIAARSLTIDNGRDGINRFSSFLPFDEPNAISLAEGSTALVRAGRLAKILELEHLYVKDESRNPTWSHKDRYSAVMASWALKVGAKVLATASSGNAGASLAAYAAKAGLPCIVATFKDAAGPMVEQIRRYGAMVVTLEDKDARWPILAEGAERFGWLVTSPFSTPVVGSNPIGIEGYKTIAYETVLQLGGTAPDWLVVPTAYGDVLAGIARGFDDLVELGVISKGPKFVAAEVYGSITRTLESNRDDLVSLQPNATTRATSIGSSQSTFQALDTVRRSAGVAVQIEDGELFNAQAQLSSTEGIFGELASAITVAATTKLRREGTIASKDVVVCLLTASGLKDLDQSTVNPPPSEFQSGRLDDMLRLLSDRYDFSPE